MVSASSLLTEDQIERINAAAAKATDRSGARIVPVVASRSGRYERAEDLVGLWAAALGLALVWLLVAKSEVRQVVTYSAAAWAMWLATMLAAIVIGFLAGGLLATQIGWLRRLFIPKNKIVATGRERARQVLADCQIRSYNQLEDRPIVLVFVSLYERFATVLADEAIQRQLTPDAIEPITDVIMAGLVQRRPCEALCRAVSLTAELVGEASPPADRKPSASQVRMCLID